jgi:SAM-dependent methyltransferase
MIWVQCRHCSASYPCIAGIPDLRLPGSSAIEQDSNQARWLVTERPRATAAELAQHIFSSQAGWSAARIALRTRQTLAAPGRLRSDLRGWLRPCLAGDTPFLDVGCGPGMLQAAAAAEGHAAIGIDVSMVWLVVAQRLIAEHGGRPVLAAARAETLPLPDAAVPSVISLDVIEHVADPVPYLRELDRVIRPGGWLALTMPNRYSLSAEPHVSMWGVGWLPRTWQPRYVTWRSGESYEDTRLLSSWEVHRLLRQHTRVAAEIRVPPVPDEEIAHFPRYRARLARLYNRLTRQPLTRPLFLGVGPFFRMIGQK